MKLPTVNQSPAKDGSIQMEIDWTSERLSFSASFLSPLLFPFLLLLPYPSTFVLSILINQYPLYLKPTCLTGYLLLLSPKLGQHLPVPKTSWSARSEDLLAGPYSRHLLARLFIIIAFTLLYCVPSTSTIRLPIPQVKMELVKFQSLII